MSVMMAAEKDDAPRRGVPRKDRKRIIPKATRVGDELRARSTSPFAKWLIAHMDRKDMDVPRLAGLSRVSVSSIYKDLQYPDPTPSPYSVMRLCKALDADLLEAYALLGYFNEPALAKLDGIIFVEPVIPEDI
jgi:hypothetical protein